MKEAYNLFESQFLDPLIVETQKARLFYFVVGSIDKNDYNTIDKEIMEKETKNFISNLTLSELKELYYESTFENFRFKTKWDAALTDDAFYENYISTFMRKQIRIEKFQVVNGIKAKMNILNDKRSWPEGMTQEKATEELEQLKVEYDIAMEDTKQNKTFPLPSPELTPDMMDFKKIVKEDFFKFYKANRLIYTRKAEKIRSDLYLNEMHELLKISLSEKIVSGLLQYERYAEISGNPIPKYLVKDALDLKRKHEIDCQNDIEYNQNMSQIGKSLNKLAYANHDDYVFNEHPYSGIFMDKYESDYNIRDQVLLERRKYWVFAKLSKGYDYGELKELTKI